ncbi:hypothetical protein BAE44_0020793 [Dichanthelium oligosanthes]|uniref:FLZ-type domain-containing protein n=1 Tax=Dichanthelium oligosanthes TaxID=888268 RepID=A0A1E5UZD3_9POAL|nr:hypothetical protein BAE44_0020793 [Dichanthelium oligosanthes]
MPMQGSSRLLSPIPYEKKRFVGAFTIGVPCILETCAGLIVALMEPADASAAYPRPRVAKSIGTSARDITLALSAKLCSVTSRIEFHVDNKSLPVTCNSCCRKISGNTIYMYTSLGFCSMDCRYVYHLGVVDKRLAMAVMGGCGIVTRMAASKASKARQVSYRRPTFFT